MSDWEICTQLLYLNYECKCFNLTIYRELYDKCNLNVNLGFEITGSNFIPRENATAQLRMGRIRWEHICALIHFQSIGHTSKTIDLLETM